MPARLGAGVSVAAWRLGAVMFTSPRSGIAITASSIPCEIPLPDEGGEDSTDLPQPVRLAVTDDGGLHWRTTGNALPERGQQDSGEQVAAADGPDVWVVTDTGVLSATRDEGASWTRQPVPPPVEATGSAGGWLWAVSCPAVGSAPCQPVVERMRLPGGPWTRTNLPVPAGPDSMQLAVTSGSTAVVTIGGSYPALVSTADGGEHWSVLPPPAHLAQNCEGDPSYIGMFAASSPDDWWVLCAPGLFRSRDAGHSWSAGQGWSVLDEVGEGQAQQPLAMAAAGPDRIWYAAQNSLAISMDGGVSWSSPAQVNPEGGPSQFDVLSATHVWLLAPGAGLWQTTNGTSWRQLGTLGPD